MEQGSKGEPQDQVEEEEEEDTTLPIGTHSTLSLFVDDEGSEGEDDGEDGDVRFVHPAGRDLTSLTITGPLSAVAMDRVLSAGQRLTRVQLSYGNLTKLPVEMCYALPHLESLSLWNNKIAHLPPQLGLLTNLTELDLTRNCLTSLPGRIVELVALRSLLVEGNRLGCFPVELGRMERLMSPQGRLFFTTNPVLPPTLVDQQRALPKALPGQPTLMELAARTILTSRSSSSSPSSSSVFSPSSSIPSSSTNSSSPSPPSASTTTTTSSAAADARLPLDLERYLDEYARCSVCGRYVWAVFVEELRYRVLRFRNVPVVYRCCSLACLRRIDDHPT